MTTLTELAQRLRDNLEGRSRWEAADRLEAIDKAWAEFGKWAVPRTKQEADLGQALALAISGTQTKEG